MNNIYSYNPTCLLYEVDMTLVSRQRVVCGTQANSQIILRDPAYYLMAYYITRVNVKFAAITVCSN